MRVYRCAEEEEEEEEEEVGMNEYKREALRGSKSAALLLGSDEDNAKRTFELRCWTGQYNKFHQTFIFVHATLCRTLAGLKRTTPPKSFSIPMMALIAPRSGSSHTHTYT